MPHLKSNRFNLLLSVLKVDCYLSRILYCSNRLIVRGSKYSTLLWLIATCSCCAQVEPLRTTHWPTHSHTEASSVMAEYVSSPPAVHRLASNDQGAVSLRAPIANEIVYTLIRRFFNAMYTQNFSLIEPDLNSSIVYFYTANEQMISRSQFLEDLKKISFTKQTMTTRLEEIYSTRELQIRTRDEINMMASVDHRLHSPQHMNDDDVLVQVPVYLSVRKSELTFAIGQRNGRYCIWGISK